VQGEIEKRVAGQYADWHDPHNNGTYTITSSSDSEIALTRMTGNKKYTDKLLFTFSTIDTECYVTACSKSQVMSIIDYSTNYCNLYDLYCSEPGCHPFSKLSYTQTFQKCSAHDNVCLAV
jgi:hypothetical protein